MRSRTQAHDQLRGIPSDFWRDAAIRSHRNVHRAVFLDYDGTLAPLRITRSRARPLPGTARLLSRIAARSDTTVAIVSGRPVAELRRLLPGLPVHLVGEHGWESQRNGCALIQRPLPRKASAALSAAAESAIVAGFARRLERKRASVVLHLRGLRASQVGGLEAEALGLWRSFAEDGSVLLRRTNGGLELRAMGHTKGTAVRELLASSLRETMPIYVGDDETDEDAFREIRDRGLAVWVGSGPNPIASGWLPSCSAVRTFLEMWERGVDAGGR
jgi:trehalose 6-phosphate phosphatase